MEPEFKKAETSPDSKKQQVHLAKKSKPDSKHKKPADTAENKFKIFRKSTKKSKVVTSLATLDQGSY